MINIKDKIERLKYDYSVSPNLKWFLEGLMYKAKWKGKITDGEMSENWEPKDIKNYEKID